MLLVVAKLLVRRVPLRVWRRSLGRVGLPQSKARDEASRRVSIAVRQAAVRLPGSYMCLPQAMAVQWMLRRRRIASALVFGAHGGGNRSTPLELHAWVEIGGQIVIGDDPSRVYISGLTLIQP
jgi:hypothetical protein